MYFIERIIMQSASHHILRAKSTGMIRLSRIRVVCTSIARLST